MASENISAIKISMKKGSLPQFTYSRINPNASNDSIYNLGVKLMGLQPEPAEDNKTQKISKCEESIITL